MDAAVSALDDLGMMTRGLSSFSDSGHGFIGYSFKTPKEYNII
jgi:hypothetical protein